MERNNSNLDWCEVQILRLEATRFYDRLGDVGRNELRDALCDSASSQVAAELRVTTRLRTHPDCPTPADFQLMEMTEQREARAQVSWKPDYNSPLRDERWTEDQRRTHDERWAAFIGKMDWGKPTTKTILSLVKRGAA